MIAEQSPLPWLNLFSEDRLDIFPNLNTVSNIFEFGTPVLIKFNLMKPSWLIFNLKHRFDFLNLEPPFRLNFWFVTPDSNWPHIYMLYQKSEWRCRDLVGCGWNFCIPGHRLILRPMLKPGGALPARYKHCCILPVLVLLAAGLALCYGESINLTWLKHK